eukprot:1160077-Pelagomonas_calceolata.AAC.3
MDLCEGQDRIGLGYSCSSFFTKARAAALYFSSTTFILLEPEQDPPKQGQQHLQALYLPLSLQKLAKDVGTSLSWENEERKTY